MRRPTRLTFDLRPLGHPVWWAALALLAANDHLLKRAGVLPGWLTGKLSDFAFLIVAPVLLASLLPAAVRPRRALAVASTAGLFAAAKVSPAISAALVAILRHVGIDWRLWTDPTDLIALAVVPVALALMRTAARPSVGRRRALEQAGVVLGAVACVATSAPPRYPHSPFLLNAAPAAVSVKVTWMLRPYACGFGMRPNIDAAAPELGDLAAQVAATVTPGDLDDPISLDVQRGQVAALDGPPAPGASPVGMCTTQTSPISNVCVGAILEAPAVAPVLMLARAEWEESSTGGSFFSCDSGPSPQSRCAPTLDPARDPGPDAVTLREIDGVLQFVAGANVHLAPIDLAAVTGRTSPAGNCRELRDRYVALLQAQPCTTDGDCVAINELPIPGVPAACGVDVNLAGARAVTALGGDWQAACVSVSAPGCYVPQPAVCRAGNCAPVCPGEQIPSCPGPCYDPNGFPGSSCQNIGTPCARPDGLVCNCVNGTIACRAPQPVSATCPLSCNDWPGGGSYVNGLIRHPPLDVDAGARPDAGGRPDAAAPPDGAGAADGGARD